MRRLLRVLAAPWRGPNGLLTSHGPVIRTVVVLQGAVALAAVAALIFAYLVFSDRLDTIQTARQRSGFDTCEILNALIAKTATNKSRATVFSLKGTVIGYVQFGDGSRAERKQVKVLISEVGLASCHQYAVAIRQGKLLRITRVRPNRH